MFLADHVFSQIKLAVNAILAFNGKFFFILQILLIGDKSATNIQTAGVGECQEILPQNGVEHKMDLATLGTHAHWWTVYLYECSQSFDS